MALSVRTLLFTDIEGSTSLLERAGGDYAMLLGRHRRMMRDAVAHAGGTEHGTEGDSFFLTFDAPTAALAAAVEAQRAIETFAWPDGMRVRVRMGAHVGEVRDDDDDLVGMSIHHAARIAAAAHGGQIVVSDRVREMAHELPDGVELRPLGTHRLRDVGAIPLFQVDHPDLQHDFPPLRGVLGHRTNLPRTTTRFVGADDLLTAIEDDFRVASLVTMTGSGGVGKTRAALEFGRRHLGEFDDGVFFVDLAPVTDTGAVAGAVAATLPILAGGDSSVLDTIVDWIGERRVLLIVDNCEHLVDDVAFVVGVLLSSCANVQLLATSREPLGVRGEQVHRVPSLDDRAAAELFCERARAVDTTFAADGRDDVVARICERLDGIPLAIELAAARMGSLSPEELLERLQDRFRLLRGSGRNVLDRHQTLRATVSWSYQLLTDDARMLFDRASVFAGGFDLRAAESVCGSEPIDERDVVDLVGSLVDKSMVIAERTATLMRYRLLETLRQYGEDQLDLRGETARVRSRHAEHYARVATELDASIRGPHGRDAIARTFAEWDNLRAAHLWALAERDLDTAERIVEGTFIAAIFRMRHEHAAMLRRTVELGDELGRPSTIVLGMLSFWSDVQGDADETFRLARRGLDVAPDPDDPSTANCWFAFSGANAAYAHGSSESREAFRHQRAALTNTGDIDRHWFELVNLIDASLHADPDSTAALRRQLSDVAARVKSPLLTLFALQYQGHAHIGARPPEFAASIPLYRELAETASAAGDLQFHGIAVRCLAIAATGIGADALAACREALDALFEARYWQKTWQALESTALALAQAGRAEQAAVVVGHLDAHWPGFGLEHLLGFRDCARDLIAAAGDHSAAMARGADMSADELVTAALSYCSADAHAEV